MLTVNKILELHIKRNGLSQKAASEMLITGISGAIMGFLFGLIF